jgi:hypothetical protein
LVGVGNAMVATVYLLTLEISFLNSVEKLYTNKKPFQFFTALVTFYRSNNWSPFQVFIGYDEVKWGYLAS